MSLTKFLYLRTSVVVVVEYSSYMRKGDRAKSNDLHGWYSTPFQCIICYYRSVITNRDIIDVKKLSKG